MISIRSVSAQNSENGWGISAGIEYLTYGDELGYGLEGEWIGKKVITGLAYVYSSSQGESVRSVTHLQKYSFTNHCFSIPFAIRLGKKKELEAGVVYSFMRSKVDYLDYYPAYYKFIFKGMYDQHYAGLNFAWRYIHPNGFFLRPSFRFGLRFANAEHPDEKVEEYYDPSFKADEIMGSVFTYTTFKMSIGLIFSGKE